MRKDVYLTELNKLKDLMKKVVDSPFTMHAKVETLVTMNMRYEKVAFNRNNEEHPYILTKRIIKDAIQQFNCLMAISFIESENRAVKKFKSYVKERKHHELFNEMWNKYSTRDFNKYIERYIYRIKINNLNKLVENKSCVDFGCGNGAFCFALLKCRADFVAGIDFTEKSIAYAKSYAERKKIRGKAVFKQSSVYKTGFKNNTFDFAVQNGVFHHLDNENTAIQEARRVLKKGGWFWYYIDGQGGISYDLWDVSVDILKDVPVFFIEDVLNFMNVSRNKIVHLTDGLSATYAHTSWDKITKKLSDNGFGNFMRLTGGFDTDFDLDKIESDPYGKEKFGEGDLRILCQLINK